MIARVHATMPKTGDAPVPSSSRNQACKCETGLQLTQLVNTEAGMPLSEGRGESLRRSLKSTVTLPHARPIVVARAAGCGSSYPDNAHAKHCQVTADEQLGARAGRRRAGADLHVHVAVQEGVLLREQRPRHDVVLDEAAQGFACRNECRRNGRVCVPFDDTLPTMPAPNPNAAAARRNENTKSL